MKTDDEKRAKAQKELEKIVKKAEIGIKLCETKEGPLSEEEKKQYEHFKTTRKKALDEIKKLKK